MNWKQSAKAAALHIEELEKEIEKLRYMVESQKRDIQDYNTCILRLISGDSACLWCEERPVCHLEAKDVKMGCSEWWLRYRKKEDDADGDEGTEENPVLRMVEQ